VGAQSLDVESLAVLELRMAVDLDEQAASRHQTAAPSLVPDTTPVLPSDWLADADDIDVGEPTVLGPVRPRRSVSRRVMERMILAALALALLAGLAWLPDGAFGALRAALVPGVEESEDVPATPDATVADQPTEPDDALAPAPPAFPTWFTRDLLSPLPPPRAAPAPVPPSTAPAARVPVPKSRQ
jgi:hypothetical protein